MRIPSSNALVAEVVQNRSGAYSNLTTDTGEGKSGLIEADHVFDLIDGWGLAAKGHAPLLEVH